MSLINRRFVLAALALAGAAGALIWRESAGAKDKVPALYAQPLPPPDGPLNTFHLGHSLVGRDMPAMLAQLAGHTYNSQLGWGTPLKAHWEPDVPINGFDAENDHPRYRDARSGIGAGTYDAVVLTEMVEINDAIRYHDSAGYLARWAKLATEANPQARIYLYETWHHTDDPQGWLTRLDADLARFWQGKMAHPAMIESDVPIYLIPAGQVMAAVLRRAETGGIDGITTVQDLFGKTPEGDPDTIHFNDLGAYLVALTHYGVLYHQTPVGLPHELTRADGTPADALSAQGAAQVQAVVWEVIGRHPETGVRS